MSDNGAGLWEAYWADRNDKTFAALVEYYQPWVRQLASGFKNNLPASVDIDDLASAGQFALMDTIRRYDIHKGASFKTFSSARIRGAMQDELRRLDFAPRITRSRHHRYAVAYERLWCELGREPADYEMAKAVKMSLRRYQEWSKGAAVFRMLPLYPVKSQDEEVAVDKRDDWQDKTAPQPQWEAQKHSLKERLMAGMTVRERIVFDGYRYHEMKMQEIGEILGISESRVSQIDSALMARLQDLWAGREYEFVDGDGK